MATKSAKPSSQPTVAKALYRRYRPTTLDAVVGQEQVTEVLKHALANHSFGHAYLFIGPRGTGKTSVARIFAHAVNDFPYELEDSYLDIIEIDAASNTGVDNIRELREKATIAPTKGKYKVYIIDEVHMLTKSAANALLKTLEEPPQHVIFILATTDAHKVPITISSRAQVHTFQLASPEIMYKHLHKIVEQEGIKIADEALKIVAERGGGSFRDTLSLLDQVRNLSDQEITAEALTSALGLPTAVSVQELLTAYANRDFSTVSSLLKDLLNSGIKPEVIASELISSIVATPRPETLSLLAKLPEVKSPFSEARLLVALLEGMNSENTSPAPVTAPTPPAAPSRPSVREQLIAKRRTTKASTRQAPAPEAEIEVTPAAKNGINTADTTDQTEEAASPAAVPTNRSENFSWEKFLEAAHNTSSVLYNQLQKVTHEFDGTTLHLYPLQKFSKNILEKPNNRQLLAQLLPGIALTIHEVGENSTPKDEKLSQISAIMGDIQELPGDQPF